MAMRPTTAVAAMSRGLFTCHPPDAARVRLRQVYAELGGMIGDSHKSERRMLFREIMDKSARRCMIAGGLKLS